MKELVVIVCGIVSVASCSFRHQNIREGEFACDDLMEGNDSYM